MGCCSSREDELAKNGLPKNESRLFQFDVYAALKRGKQEEIAVYIPKKFDINYRMPAFMGRSALHIAAEYAGRNVIAFLINSGADSNALDNSGCPPIFLAMANGNFEAVTAIYELSLKVNLNIVTQHGMSFHDFISPCKRKQSLALIKRLGYTKVKFKE